MAGTMPANFSIFPPLISGPFNTLSSFLSLPLSSSCLSSSSSLFVSSLLNLCFLSHFFLFSISPSSPYSQPAPSTRSLPLSSSSSLFLFLPSYLFFSFFFSIFPTHIRPLQHTLFLFLLVISLPLSLFLLPPLSMLSSFLFNAFASYLNSIFTTHIRPLLHALFLFSPILLCLLIFLLPPPLLFLRFSTFYLFLSLSLPLLPLPLSPSFIV